jgi:hypothetical protein
MRKQLERWARHAERALLPAPVPDFTGWSPSEILLWRARNGGFEDDVAGANEGRAPQMVTAAEREAEMQAVPKAPTEQTSPDAAAIEPPPPAQVAPPPEGRSIQLAWQEELCRWRRRGPQDDDDWDDDPSKEYQIEVDYDPLEGM